MRRKKSIVKTQKILSITVINEVLMPAFPTGISTGIKKSRKSKSTNGVEKSEIAALIKKTGI